MTGEEERSLKGHTYLAASIAASFLALTTLVPSVSAQTNEPFSGGRGEWREMRQEMVQACANKSVGASCSFSWEGQTVTGTCRQTRRGQLVCRAARGRRGGM